MQLKKWGMIGLCVLMVAGSAGCTPKETETVKTEIEEPEEEQPEEELSREIKKDEEKRRSYINDEAIELYPELKEVKAHLIETYADVLVAEKPKMENARDMVTFGYWGGGVISHTWE